MGLRDLRERLAAIDLRSLAAFRIGLGITILADLATRAGALEQHYTDHGVLPREFFARLILASDWQWSLHFLTGSTVGQAMLFAVAAAAAVALCAGYRTRLATVASWVLLVSLQVRNPLVLYGADQLLRLLLFWAMFLPLGARWSVDRHRGRDAAAGAASVCSPATLALLLQPCLMLFFAGLLKRNDSWETGNALAHALSADMYVTSLGRWLAGFPAVVGTLGHAVPWLEMLAPLLLFSPWRTRAFRVSGLLLLLAFHGAMALCLVTGLFPLVTLVALVPFVPGKSGKPCTMHELHTEAGAKPVEVGAMRSPAALATVGRGLVAMLLGYSIAWNVVGLHAGEYAAQQSLPWAREWWSKGHQGLPLTFRDYAVERRMGALGWLGRVAALYQRWDMFVRVGPEIRGWPVVIGTLEDGRTVSVLEDGLPTGPGSQPADEAAAAFYPGTRWLVYLTSLRNPGMRAERELFASVIARDWQRRHPQMPLARLRIQFVQPAIPGEAPSTARSEVWYDGPATVGAEAD